MKSVDEMTWAERASTANLEGYRYLLAAKKCFELAEVATERAKDEDAERKK